MMIGVNLFFTLFSFGQISNDSTPISENKTISVIGVGDVMIGSSYPLKSELPANNDCYPLLASVKPYLQDADITVGNLEGCFSDDAPLVKHCNDTTKCYAFRMPESYALCLEDAGFDVLTIANNHSGDFGDLGRATTVKMLDSLNIYHAGWIKYPTAIFTKDGITYGIAAFAPNSGTVNINDTNEAKNIVSTLKKKADIVIVTFHGGAEGNQYQHITRKTEEFYGENRGNVYQFARTVIDAGADIVFGSGPHVARAIDLYKNKFIAYSLGNFCTYGRINVSGVNGLAPIVKINIDLQGNFIDGQIYSACQRKFVGTLMDPSNTAAKTIKSLTEADIPECPLKIDEQGYICKALPKQ